MQGVALLAAIALLAALPHRRAIRLGAALGDLVRLVGVRRRVVLENIAASGLELPPGGPEALARACYRNMGRVFAEYARMPRLTREDYLRLVTHEGIEHIHEAMAGGRGVIALSGHFGSLELMAASFRHAGVHPTLLVAPMRNPIATRILRKHRRAAGVDILEVGPELREAYRVLRRGGFLCMASDQDAGRRGVFVDFLGRPASTPTGPIELALATGAPIVFGTIHRVATDRHVVRIRPPVWPERDGDRGATVLRYSQLFARWLEEAIRADADHWFWLHRRWKTRPDSPSRAPAR